MHDGNQRYKIHIRLRGRHRGKGAGHAEAQSAMRTPGNTVAAQGAAPGNAAGPAPARDGEITAGGGAPHAPGACLPDAHAPRGQPAQQTGGQPHGQNLLQYSRTPFSELFFQANGAVRATANAAARAYPSGTPHTDKRRGIPTAAARENHLQSQAFFHPAPDAPSCGKKRRPGSPTPRSSTNGCTRNSRP